MAWQRKIPFGYQMQVGTVGVQSMEGKAVQSIFTQYLAGDSLQKIAETMEKRSIYYHAHTPSWNKNMVKRILENEVYLGRQPYPALITKEEFEEVRILRSNKNTYRPCPEETMPFREKLTCGLCGAKMVRGIKSYGQTRWQCVNPACGCAVRLDDETLGRRVSERLHALAEHPSLLTPPPPGQDAGSHDAVRIQNELNLALNRGSEPPEYIKTLAFAAAAARYQAIQDPTPDHRLAELRAQLEQGVSDENILQTLMETAVNAIRLMPSKIVDLELVNGRILSDCLEGETS